MHNANIDPDYYRSDEDDDGRTHEAHGYWTLSERFDQARRVWWETKQAVDEGQACWVLLERDVPFL